MSKPFQGKVINAVVAKMGNEAKTMCLIGTLTANADGPVDMFKQQMVRTSAIQSMRFNWQLGAIEVETMNSIYHIEGSTVRFDNEILINW